MPTEIEGIDTTSLLKLAELFGFKLFIRSERFGKLSRALESINCRFLSFRLSIFCGKFISNGSLLAPKKKV